VTLGLADSRVPTVGDRRSAVRLVVRRGPRTPAAPRTAVTRERWPFRDRVTRGEHLSVFFLTSPSASDIMALHAEGDCVVQAFTQTRQGDCFRSRGVPHPSRRPESVRLRNGSAKNRTKRDSSRHSGAERRGGVALGSMAPEWTADEVVGRTMPVFFASVSCVSAWEAYHDRQTCSCFGTLEISPRYTFALDLIILTITTIVYKNLSLLPTQRRTISRSVLFRVGIYVAGMISVVVAIGVSGLVSYSELVNAMNGEVLEVRPHVSRLGESYSGDVVVANLEIVNKSDSPITLLGGSASCGCLLTRDLPAVVGPRASVTIQIFSRASTTPGKYSYRFALFTNHPAQPRIDGGLVGLSIAKP